MDRQLLNEAAKQLRPLKVLLTDSNIRTSDANQLEQLPYELETYKAARELTIHDSEEENSDFKFLYVYKYEVGIRGVILEAETSNDTQEAVFEITASFKAFYSSETELTEECAKEFGKFNVGHTVWPYWREYVHSTSARVGLPAVNIPFYSTSS